MDLGIVIVSYNTRELTAGCLASVQETLRVGGWQAEVWLVDNASADGSAEMVLERFPWVRLVASDQNLGFAAGTNLGIERLRALEAPPTYVLLLNPDTELGPGALAAMLTFMEQHPEAGLAGAQLLYGDGSFQHGAFHFPTLPMIALDFWPLHHRLLDSPLNGRYPRRRYQRKAPFPIDHPLGAAMLVRWQTLEQVGVLDEGYFMYCEEIDWCMRIKQAGWRIYCVPAARIVHYAGQSTRQFRDRMFVALWRSRFRLFEQHYSRNYQRLARCLVRAGIRHEMRRMQGAVQRQELAPDDAEPRIAAYQQVMEM